MPQAGDLKMLDRIMALTRKQHTTTAGARMETLPAAEHGVPTASPVIDGGLSHVASALQESSVAMALTQASAVFERWSGELLSLTQSTQSDGNPECPAEERNSRVKDAASSIQSASAVLISGLSATGRGDRELKSNQEKVRRALERLRRTVLKIVESSPRDAHIKVGPDDVTHNARSILCEISNTLVGLVEYVRAALSRYLA